MKDQNSSGSISGQSSIGDIGPGSSGSIAGQSSKGGIKDQNSSGVTIGQSSTGNTGFGSSGSIAGQSSKGGIKDQNSSGVTIGQSSTGNTGFGSSGSIAGQSSTGKIGTHFANIGSTFQDYNDQNPSVQAAMQMAMAASAQLHCLTCNRRYKTQRDYDDHVLTCVPA